MRYGLGQRARWLILVLVVAGHGLVLLLPGPRPAALPVIPELQVRISAPTAVPARPWPGERQALPAPAIPAPARPVKRSAVADPDSRQVHVEPPRPAVLPGTSAPLAPSISAGAAETATSDKAGDKRGPLTGTSGEVAGAEPGLAAAALRTPASCDTRLRDADYPALARRHGIEGRVLVQASVLQSGRLDEVRVIRSSGFAVLDEAALRAGRRWRCTPARYEGMARDSVISVPVVFRIED